MMQGWLGGSRGRAPAAYSGRWPHIHFEVYPSLDAATTASGKLRTSQMALPEAACRQVYATEGYSQSLQNLSQTSLATDMVFSDGYQAFARGLRPSGRK
jgi:protocatechuate 3,4-dioxygenase beta subunit